MLDKLMSLSKAVIDQVKAGWPAASEEDQAKRWEECLKCEKYIADEVKCGECHCYLKFKTAWASQECPLGKWKRVDVKEK